MRLRQVLLNLADNSVKYNDHGGRIEMALQRSGDEAVFFIRNTGSALAPDLEARVFERFFRGDPAHGGAIEGSGLGLSIAKSIVEAHGGTIAYEVLPDGRTQVTLALAAVPPRSPDFRKMKIPSSSGGCLDLGLRTTVTRHLWDAHESRLTTSRPRRLPARLVRAV